MKTPIITDITAYKKVEIKSVECTACGLPASLNADGLCSHCIIRPRRGAVSGPTIGLISNIKYRISNWLRSGDAGPLTAEK